MNTIHIQIYYKAYQGHSDYPQRACDYQSLESAIHEGATIYVNLCDQNQSREWIAGDIAALERCIQERYDVCCRHSFRDWEFGKAIESSEDCECRINGVAVDLIVESR